MGQTDRVWVVGNRSKARVAPSIPERARTVARVIRARIVQGRARVGRGGKMEPEPRYVGIDVAKARLEVAVRPTGEGWTSPYDEAAVQGLVSQLEQLEPVMVLLEASGGLEVPLVAALAAGHADPGSQLPGCPQTPGDGPAGLGEESPGVRQGRRTSQDRGAHRLAQRGAGQWAWAGPAPESGMAREGGVAAHGSRGGTATLLDPTGLSAGTGGPGPKGDLRPGRSGSLQSG